MQSDGLLVLLGLALLPAVANFAGGLLAEPFRISDRTLNRVLHAAAGIVVAVVAVEIMPTSLEAASGYVAALAFAIGGLAYLGLRQAVSWTQRRSGSGEGAGMWMTYIAVATDLFSDGLLIGSGSAMGSGLGLVLALGQMLADLPEGFAVIANFKSKGVPRSRRIWLAASFALPILVAAAASYLLLRGQSAAWQAGALVFTAGLLSVAVVEDLIVEAHNSAKDRRGTLLFFVAGFVLFTLVSAGLEQGS